MLTASWSAGSNRPSPDSIWLHTEALELAQELAPDHLDALQERFGRRRSLRRVQRALEIVDDLEELGQDLPTRALDVFRDLPSQTKPHLLEL